MRGDRGEMAAGRRRRGERACVSLCVGFCLIICAMSWVSGEARADEAPAARESHRWFGVAIALMREDVEAGEPIGRYTSDWDRDARVILINRLAAIAEGEGGAKKMARLEAAWRDVGTASWEGIYRAGVRCSDALLDGGRVLTYREAVEVALFIRMTDGVEATIRDAVLVDGEAEGEARPEKFRSLTRLGGGGKKRNREILLWVDGEEEPALRAWVRDAVVVLIEEEVSARTEEHRAAVKKIRPKRN